MAGPEDGGDAAEFFFTSQEEDEGTGGIIVVVVAAVSGDWLPQQQQQPTAAAVVADTLLGKRGPITGRPSGGRPIKPKKHPAGKGKSQYFREKYMQDVPTYYLVEV